MEHATRRSTSILLRLARGSLLPVFEALVVAPRTLSPAKSKLLSRAFHRSKKDSTDSFNELFETKQEGQTTVKNSDLKSTLDPQLRQFMISLKPVDLSFDEKKDDVAELRPASLSKSGGPRCMSSRPAFRKDMTLTSRQGLSPEAKLSSRKVRSSSAKRRERPQISYSKKPGLTDAKQTESKCTQADILISSLNRELKIHSNICKDSIRQVRAFLHSLEGVEVKDKRLVQSVSILKEVEDGNFERLRGVLERLLPIQRVDPVSAEYSLTQVLKSLTVRRLQELRPSPRLEAETVDAMLGLIILFSGIDSEIEVTPGFRVMRSRALKLVTNYLSIPGHVIKICRSYVQKVKKGEVSASKL